jgi:hypothetical protein
VRLFDRVVELTVGETEITGLDIAFEIEKNLEKEPNPCHIEIFNLALNNREILSKYKRVPVLLKAGYQGNVGIIFQGDMIRCSHIKEGPTWKSTLVNGDGANAIQSARINKNFAKGTPVKTVIKEIAAQLGLAHGSAIKQCDGLANNLERGFSASGNPMDELCRILHHFGYGASVQNQALQIIKQGEPLGKEAINLSTDSGLTATPELGSDKKIQLKSVLMPELLPGSTVHVDSAVFKGFVTIQNVRFEGANFNEAWGSEMEVMAN